MNPPTPNTQPPRARKSLRERAGMALVVTLALLVLVTITTLAFFVRATSNRAIEASRSNQVLVREVANTAGDYVIGRLLAEMPTNAVAATNNGIVIFQVTNGLGMLPTRSLAQAAMTNDPNFANLTRQSIPSADPSASLHNVSVPSKNGRSIGVQRWNAPFLLTGPGFSANNELASWIYLNRDGSTTSTASTNAVGRFAYNIYNTGGLLDASVAGHPTSVTGTNLSKLTGTLAGINLSAIPGMTNVNQFVEWRNPTSASSAATYVSAVLQSSERGFLTPAPGDRTFTSRRDLIQLAREGTFGFNTNALPSLTHSTRALNAPSWGPSTNATGAAYQYFANASTPTAINRLLPSVRVPSNFTRPNGKTAVPGEPLLASRFPLSRLNGLGISGVVSTGNTTLLNGVPSPATAATVQRDFGLRWDVNRWEYVGHTGIVVQSAIKTLSQIALEAREPNFFELLKAGILNGSLAMRSANINLAIIQTNELNEDSHIIQIGANIIDQNDSDDFPTTIRFTTPNFTRSGNTYTIVGLIPTDLYGIENLPYLSELRFRSYRTDPMLLGLWDRFNGAMLVELWNPHRNASTNSVPSLRIRLTSSGFPRQQIGTGSHDPFLNTTDGLGGPNDLTPFIVITNSGATFSEPRTVGPADVTAVSRAEYMIPAILAPKGSCIAYDTVHGNAPAQVGFYLGYVPALDQIFDPPSPRYWWSKTNLSAVDFELQYWDGSQYRTYQRFARLGDGFGGQFGTTASPGYIDSFSSESYNLMMGRPEPRGNRLGMSESKYDEMFSVNRPATKGMDVSEQNATGSADTPGLGPQGPLFTPIFAPNTTWMQGPGGFGPRLGWYSDNTGSGSHARPIYRDADGISRRADGDNANSIRPLIAGQGDNRPVILNRPFRNVAELGYVFRDQPWKTLDLFSSGSADSGLLDIFSVSESPTAVVAGKINLNTRNPSVIKLLLEGAARNFDGSAPLNSTDATTLAADYVNPAVRPNLIHRSSIVEAFRPTQGGASPSFTVSSVFPALKMQREVTPRALVDLGETMTWNLLVDVVAQYGRFAPAGTTPDQFNVDGEQRIWLHTAIDRSTGKIIDRMVETISE